jgi:hypothetical protein
MKPGDLMRIKRAPDQVPWVRLRVGKLCLLIRKLTREDGVLSSERVWQSLIGEEVFNVHELDLEPIE